MEISRLLPRKLGGGNVLRDSSDKIRKAKKQKKTESRMN